MWGHELAGAGETNTTGFSYEGVDRAVCCIRAGRSTALLCAEDRLSVGAEPAQGPLGGHSGEYLERGIRVKAGPKGNHETKPTSISLSDEGKRFGESSFCSGTGRQRARGISARFPPAAR